jgi:hypothetical protein
MKLTTPLHDATLRYTNAYYYAIVVAIITTAVDSRGVP